MEELLFCLLVTLLPFIAIRGAFDCGLLRLSTVVRRCRRREAWIGQSFVFVTGSVPRRRICDEILLAPVFNGVVFAINVASFSFDEVL